LHFCKVSAIIEKGKLSNGKNLDALEETDSAVCHSVISSGAGFFAKTHRLISAALASGAMRLLAHNLQRPPPPRKKESGPSIFQVQQPPQKANGLLLAFLAALKPLPRAFLKKPTTHLQGGKSQSLSALKKYTNLQEKSNNLHNVPL